jgi:hypothetical protein
VPDRAGAVGSHRSRGGGRRDPRRGCLARVCVCVCERQTGLCVRCVVWIYGVWLLRCACLHLLPSI